MPKKPASDLDAAIDAETEQLSQRLHAVHERMAAADAVVNHFGLRLRELRAAKGWGQVDLAEHCGLASTTISFTERTAGGNGPSLRILLLLAGALGVSVEDLLLPPSKDLSLDDIPESRAGRPALPGVKRPKSVPTRAKTKAQKRKK